MKNLFRNPNTSTTDPVLVHQAVDLDEPYCPLDCLPADGICSGHCGLSCPAYQASAAGQVELAQEIEQNELDAIR